jgi:hypothetical protein
MYFALVSNLAGTRLRRASSSKLPFRRISLLLDLGEDALRLVVDAMRTRRHLPVTFDLLLSAHIASLSYSGLAGRIHRAASMSDDLPWRSFSSSLHWSPRRSVESGLL